MNQPETEVCYSAEFAGASRMFFECDHIVGTGPQDLNACVVTIVFFNAKHVIVEPQRALEVTNSKIDMRESVRLYHFPSRKLPARVRTACGVQSLPIRVGRCAGTLSSALSCHRARE